MLQEQQDVMVEPELAPPTFRRGLLLEALSRLGVSNTCTTRQQARKVTTSCITDAQDRRKEVAALAPS